MMPASMDKARCPHCQSILSVSLGAQGLLQDGDVTICMYCAGPAVIHDGVRARPTTDELDVLLNDRTFSRLLMLARRGRRQGTGIPMWAPPEEVAS